MEEKGLAKQETSLVKQEKSIAAQRLEYQQATLGQEVAMKALELVKPMIRDVVKQLSDTLGDNEQIIVIRKTKADSPVSIMVLDTKKEFIIEGGEKFRFTGKPSPENPKVPYAIKKFYIAEEFVDMLLTGRLTELTEKLMK